MVEKSRIYELDSLRGIAAILVALCHYTNYSQSINGHAKLYQTIFTNGYYGVHLFFIISGFVIYMTVLNCADVKEFVIKRIIRLYPLYVFSLILIFIIVSIFGLEGREITWHAAILNLTMIQLYLPSVGFVDGAHWTLCIEVVFYFIIAAILFIKKLKNVIIICGIWLAAAFVFIGINSLVEINVNIGHIIRFGMITDYCHLFIAGIVFYHLKMERKIQYYLLLTGCLAYGFVNGGIKDGIVITFLFIVFIALIHNKLGFLKYKIFIALGNISYALYLVHQNIGYIIINSLKKNGFTSEFTLLLVPLGISLLLAWVMIKFVEKPIQTVLKKLFASKNKKSPAIS